MKKVKIICILFLSSFSLLGQNASHQKGDSLYQYSHDMPAAIASYRTALEQYYKSEDQFNAEAVAISIGRSLYNMGMYDSARHFLGRMSFMHNDNIFAKNRVLGDVAFAMNSDYHGAIAYYHKSRKLLPVIETVSINERINLLFYLAEAHNSLWQYDSARHYLALSLAQAGNEKAGRKLNEAKYYYSVAKTFIYQQIPDSVKYYLARSESVFKKADKQHRDYFYHLSHMHEISAYFYDRIGYRDSVLYHANKEIEYLGLDPQTDKVSLAQAYVNVANDHINEGLFNQASAYLEDALELYSPLVDKAHKNLAHAYLIKGRLLSSKPQALNEALTFFLESINILDDTFGKNHPATAEPKNLAAGIFYRLKHYDKALMYYEDAQRIALASSDPQSLMESYLGMGKLFTTLNRYNEAQKSLETGWNILRKARGSTDFPNGNFAMAMAELYVSQENDTQAMAYFHKAIGIYKLNVGEIHPVIAGVYLQMAKVALKNKGYTEALAFLSKSNNANRQPDFNTEELILADFGVAIEVNTMQANVLMANFNANQDYALLLRAKELYFKNSEVLFDLLLSQQVKDDLEHYSSLHKETFKGAAAIVLQELSIKPSEQLKKELFLLSERSRSVLLKIQQLKVLNSSSRETDESTNLEISKKQELINYYKSLYNATPIEAAAKRKQYQSTLFNLNLALNKLKASDTDPDLVSFHEELTSDLTSIQSQLNPEQTIIEYMVLDSSLLIFVLTNGSYDFTEVELPTDFQTNLKSFKSSLIKEDFSAFQTASTSLYKLLVLPVKSLINTSRIVVIPDGQLWNVHFDLLTVPDQRNFSSFKEQDLLLKQFAISHAYSLSSLIQSKKKHKKARYNLLALSYDKKTTTKPQFSAMRNSRLADLPGTALEIFNLNRIIKGDYLFGKEASEQAFKEMATDFQVLHLALHADVDSLNNELTKLYFIQNEEDSLNDGLLYAYEIYNLKLNAELAVLSACNTGSGVLNQGEGVMSLGRAFQYAGVNSLLLSQWEVSDAAAPAVIEEFYSGLKRRMPKDEALRQAKLSFLENANNVSANPLYWGSFFILGSSEPIDLKDRSLLSRYWYVIAVLAAMALYFTNRIRRKRNLD